jgi:chromosomal replication initiator protein
LTSKNLDLTTVTAILAEETAIASGLMTIADVAQAVAERFNVRVGALRGPSRRASITAARHVAMHVARMLTGSSFAAIGEYFGGRDPATVRYACKTAAARIAADPGLAAVVATITQTRTKPDA